MRSERTGAIEEITRECKVSPGLTMVEYTAKDRRRWILKISPGESETIKKEGIRQAKKMKIPYEITE